MAGNWLGVSTANSMPPSLVSYFFVIQAKIDIRATEVRYVGEDRPTHQALLEIYVATVTEAKYNDFDNH